MKKLTFAVLALSTMGLIAFPVKANQTVIQNSRQESYINRDYNRNSRYQGRGSYQRYRRINIPRGHYPPPGECKIWNPALPPGQQPPPIRCSSLPTQFYGDGRIILYSDGTQEPF